MNSEEKNTAYEKLTPQRKQLVDKVMENLEKGNFAYVMRYTLWDTRGKTRQTCTWTMTVTDGGTLIL